MIISLILYLNFKTHLFSNLPMNNSAQYSPQNVFHQKIYLHFSDYPQIFERTKLCKLSLSFSQLLNVVLVCSAGMDKVTQTQVDLNYWTTELYLHCPTSITKQGANFQCWYIIYFIFYLYLKISLGNQQQNWSHLQTAFRSLNRLSDS